MQKPRVKSLLTIRLSSNEDTVTVDGHVYDRSKMDRDQKWRMRRAIVDGLFPPKRGRK